MPKLHHDIDTADRSFEEACVDAKMALHANGTEIEDARILGFYPRAHRNPFQDMLYASSFEQGFACFSLRKQNEAKRVFSDVPLYIHYHWVHRVFNDVANRRDASRAAKKFLNTVDAQKDAGMQTLWTVHNLISHESRFPEEEIELRAGLSARIDHVHIMNPATRELCAQYYPLDSSKVFAVQHPSYYGVYSNYISVQQARLELGITPGEKVLLLFGSMGPHKGARQFLEELDSIEAAVGTRLRVLIAGTTARADYMEDMYALAAAKSNVTLIQHHVYDHGMQILFRAADVAVCPYSVALNSGVTATAATFGCVSVVPDILVPAMIGAEAGVVGFNAKDRKSLGIAIMRGLEAAENPAVKPALARWAEKHRPSVVSQAFFKALRERACR